MDTLFLFSMRFAIIHIINDRFLEIYLNIKYPLYMNSKRIKMIACMVWLISLIFATTRLLLCMLYSDKSVHLKFYDTTVLLLDVLIVLLAIGTYSYFYIMVKKMHQKNTTRKSTFKRFKVPFLVILTFILFNVTSTIVLTVASYSVLRENVEDLLWHFSIFLDITGFISDVCIYVFLQKEIRKLCLVLMRNFCRNRSSISSSDHGKQRHVTIASSEKHEERE